MFDTFTITSTPFVGLFLALEFVRERNTEVDIRLIVDTVRWRERQFLTTTTYFLRYHTWILT